MFSDHNGIKLEINNRKISGKISGKSPNIWKPINAFLNNPYIKEKNQKGKLDLPFSHI